MWTHNASWGLGRMMGGGGAGSSGDADADAVGALGIVLGVLGVVTVVLNLLLLLSILLHPPARSRCFHLHIANMAAAALLQGGAVLPLWTHYLLHGSWLHGDSLCRWWLAADTMASCVTAFAIVLTACDRFIYLICWRSVREGGKYILCFLFVFLSWLGALSLTLTLTFMDADEARGGGHIGVQGVGGLCSWGGARGEKLAAARLIVFAIGAGLGTGLTLALILLPCLGRGDVLPIDEDEGEHEVRRRSMKKEEKETERKKRKTSSKAPPQEGDAAGTADTLLIRRQPNHHHPASGIEVKPGEIGYDDYDDDDDENFPRFLMVPKTDRLEERDRWKWQVVSLLTVAVAWALLWLPSHLFVLLHKLGLGEEAGWSALTRPFTLLTAVTVGYFHAVLAPLLWLIHQPVRSALRALILCQCCRHSDDDDDDNVFEDSVEFQDAGHYCRPTTPAVAGPSSPSSSSPAKQPPASAAAPPDVVVPGAGGGGGGGDGAVAT